MTLEILQKEMIKALKGNDKIRKNVLSGLIAQIKKTAIDNGCRDNITEELVNKELLKAKKQAKESLDAAYTAYREDLITEYTRNFSIICSYCPVLLDNEESIRELFDNYIGQANKSAMMKWLKANYSGKIDMKIAAKVVSNLLQ